ncbi:glycoside hydrolase family 15 protein [Lichenibacterium dinghuense]|uniref:glycoside hydrolase family 15 protein n=1 Tax=Lichenibacterium dinghuense TaxID=2895977 RepID=UPI001F2C1CD6|nr:glycoside hydrolase family 15 protein [Lichenibacterium sp. 6Y81]
MVHLCTYAPTGALVAAPTTSLPERVPGTYNYDYRYCWIRDGSLTVSLLAQLGDARPVSRFLDFVAARLRPETDDKSKLPLQVLYRIDGGAKTSKDERSDISGYRDCQPVQMGNAVYQMHEIDGFGFLADCIHGFVEAGGALEDRHWEVMRRLADFIAQNWAEKDAGTWELMPSQDFTATKVMNWVALDRAIAVAERTGRQAPARWAQSRDRVRADVLEHGWSEKAGAFRQRYGSDALDGTALLIPLMGFLPPDDPKVRATVERVEKVLKLNGLVHRFVPEETPGRPDQPMGDREGAFLMCTMWLAEAWQMLGEPEKAKRALEHAEACRGTNRLFSEAGDARQSPSLLGNMPLLFTEAAYARAAMAVG